MGRLSKGCVQIYTGDGKGKTTAALGLAVRAAVAGLRVFFCQFLKGGRSGEIRMLRARFPEVDVETFGGGRFIWGKPSARDKASAGKGLARLRERLLSGEYDIVIADEINVAVSMGLLPVDEVRGLIRERPDGVELVLTGRGADRRLVKDADLVTEMRNVKHYFDRGVRARKGIER